MAVCLSVYFFVYILFLPTLLFWLSDILSLSSPPLPPLPPSLFSHLCNYMTSCLTLRISLSLSLCPSLSLVSLCFYLSVCLSVSGFLFVSALSVSRFVETKPHDTPSVTLSECLFFSTNTLPCQFLAWSRHSKPISMANI